MSYLLPHLHKGFAVDQAILSVRFGAVLAGRSQAQSPVLHTLYASLTGALDDISSTLCWLLVVRRYNNAQEEDRVVVMRFGHDWDQTCMQMDEVGCGLLGSA